MWQVPFLNLWNISMVNFCYIHESLPGLIYFCIYLCQHPLDGNS